MEKSKLKLLDQICSSLINLKSFCEYGIDIAVFTGRNITLHNVFSNIEYLKQQLKLENSEYISKYNLNDLNEQNLNKLLIGLEAMENAIKSEYFEFNSIKIRFSGNVCKIAPYSYGKEFPRSFLCAMIEVNDYHYIDDDGRTPGVKMTTIVCIGNNLYEQKLYN